MVKGQFVAGVCALGCAFLGWTGCSAKIDSLENDSVQASAITTSINIGETAVLGTSDSANANLLIAQKATLTQTATLQTLSFYVGKAAGSLTLGLYDSTGAGGGPGALLASTSSFAPIAGWNTQPVSTQVVLTAGSYWLSYLPSSNALTFENTSSGASSWRNFSYGPMPSSFGTPQSGAAVHWSFYATLVPAASDAGADTGAPDARADAGSDAGAADAHVDSGTVDAGADQGSADSGTADARADSGSADAGTTDANGDTGTHADAGRGSPTFVQHVSSSVNPAGQGEIGNSFRFTLPNAVGAGNCLVLGLSYDYSSSRTVSVTDSNGNTWPSAPAVTTNDGLHLISSIYVLPNANAGATTITVTFDRAIRPVQYTLSEFYNVATVSPVNGSARAVGNGPNLATGSFTPGNNNASGGNLVWTYFCDTGEGGFSHTATNVAPGSGFTLLDADIAWPDQGMPHASEYFVQGSSAPINPGMTVTQATSDTFLGLAVALKAASAGTAPPGAGIRIVRVNHNTSEIPTAPTWNVQLPSVGNLLVLSTADYRTNLLDITSITDSNGNSWALSQFDPGSPQIWYAANAKPGNNLKLSLHISGTPGGGASLQLWDIVNAAAAPLDRVAGVTQTDDPNGANLSNTPVITPTTAGGLTIAVVALGRGPSSGLNTGSPPGAIFDLVYYAGETDFDTMDNADGLAHVYNSNTATETWNWVLANGSGDTNYSSTAVHFNGSP